MINCIFSFYFESVSHHGLHPAHPRLVTVTVSYFVQLYVPRRSDLHVGLGAEVSVAEVADAGDHVELLVDARVYRGSDDLHLREGIGDCMYTCTKFRWCY